MKTTCLKTVVLVVAWCCTMGAWAYDFKVKGIYYESIIYTSGRTVKVVAGETKYSGDVTIPAMFTYSARTYRVTSIGSNAFSGCRALTSIVIPEGISSIGENAFYDCSSLDSIVIPEGVTSIGRYAFYDCSSLTSITLPESLVSISRHTFKGCSSLASITIPSGVTSIGENVFTYCSSLDSLVIPEGVTSIGRCAFYDCSSLTSITLPESLTSIESLLFAYCSSLTSITIPSGVTFIGDNAFYACNNLREIHSLAITPPTCESDCFRVYKSDCILYVPKGTLEAYKAADGWKEFKNIVEEEYTGIEEVGADSAGQAVITACGDGIVVENLPAGTAVTVYTLSGTVVYEGVASGSRTELTLPAGHLYLVKCGPTVTKVAL